MTLSSDGKTVTVKLGTQQSGATGTLATATSTAKFQWTPSAAALSARGTACSTAVVTVSNSGLDF